MNVHVPLEGLQEETTTYMGELAAWSCDRVESQGCAFCIACGNTGLSIDLTPKEVQTLQRALTLAISKETNHE